jgi:hypothetical protein
MTVTANNPSTTIAPVTLTELTTPFLSAEQKGVLVTLLNNVIAGGRSSVSVLYEKQTKAKSRSAEKGDYVALPGVAHQSQIGDIVKVARRRGDGGVYFTIASVTRGDGEKPGYTAIRPEGLLSVAVTLLQRPTEQSA